MLDFWTAMVVAPIAALWMGFFLERGYRQGTTFNLIGYAGRMGLSSRRAELAVSKHFAKWDWLLLALALYSGALAIIFHLHGISPVLIAGLAVTGLALFLKCSLNLMHHYIEAQKELS